MDNSVYEVEYEDLRNFLDQIKKDCIKVVKNEVNDQKIDISTYSIDGMRHFTNVVMQDGESHYYIYDMPLPEERKAPKVVRKIILQDKDDVQAFFNILNKVYKENKND